VTPLDELSELLGVPVTLVWWDDPPRCHFDTRYCRSMSELDVFGRRKRQGWTVAVTGRRRLSVLASSDEIRKPDRLNDWARRWGRDPDFPALTANDGSRLLRLTHEAVESQE
jgi:hypothetical protein